MPKADDTPAPKTTTPAPQPKAEYAPAASLDPEELAEFSAQPARVQALIASALELTKLNLTYTYGSSDPASGGMDCSGTIFHLLESQGFKEIPRDSSGQYGWVRRAGAFYAVVSRKADSFEFADLKPGDLMFWTGTYQVERDIPVSHVMLYLGTEKKAKKRVMFGSSDGRSYNGIRRWGVSVFDFKMPKTDSANTDNGRTAVFVGYGRIPGLRDADAGVKAPTVASATPAPTPKTRKSGADTTDGDASTAKKKAAGAAQRSDVSEPTGETSKTTPAPKTKKKSSVKR